MQCASIVVGLFAAACDECRDSARRCEGNTLQVCYCDEGCAWDDGLPPCEDGLSCVEEGDRAVCAHPEPCPDGERESHCAETVAVQCLGGHLVSRRHCTDDRPCKVFDEGAYCGAPPGYCVENEIPTCQDDVEYLVCEDRYPAIYECPAGTLCDPSVQRGNPCRPPVDAMTSGAPDAG
jgi:hypothetical protein